MISREIKCSFAPRPREFPTIDYILPFYNVVNSVSCVLCIPNI